MTIYNCMIVTLGLDQDRLHILFIILTCSSYIHCHGKTKNIQISSLTQINEIIREA